MTVPGRRVRALVIGGAVVCLLGLGIWWIVRPGPTPVTITAEFASAPGLYDGNSVDVLGMPVGKVIGIKPGPDFVRVTMTVPRSVPIPAGANAVITAPNVVNDRYVELQPAYAGGAVMADRAVIPTARTALPISVDQIIGSLDKFSKALGPNGANANGALSTLVANLARTFGTNGSQVNAAIQNLGNGLGALSTDGPDLTALIDNLGSLTHVASQYTANYQTFATDLATVSTYLSGDDASLGAALSNLQQALGQLASFIQADGAALGGSVSNLSTFAAAIAREQLQVGKVFATLPVALQNLSAAFDPNAPGGSALVARLDPLSGSAKFATSVCGSPLLRLLLLVPSVAPQPDRNATNDLACGVNGLLANLAVPPGASAGPNMSVSALVGGR